jgi:hypothetical protein
LRGAARAKSDKRAALEAHGNSRPHCPDSYS